MLSIVNAGECPGAGMSMTVDPMSHPSWRPRFGISSEMCFGWESDTYASSSDAAVAYRRFLSLLNRSK